MEAPDDIPVYPLLAILNMDDLHLPSFQEFFALTDPRDLRGQIAIKLNEKGKLALPIIIDRAILPELIIFSRLRAGESTDPSWGIVTRYQRMLQGLVIRELRARMGILTESGELPVTRTGPAGTDPTMRVDPTIEVENRGTYFELDAIGYGVYMEHTDGPYESAFHSSIMESATNSGNLYLLYGTITPDLTRQKELVKALVRRIGWMPNLREKGWIMILNQMGEHLKQHPLPFVGLISIQGTQILQVNGETILCDTKADPETRIIQTETSNIIAAARDGTEICDYFGDSASNEGVWFEIPTLNTTSPRISTAGLRCIDENEIIGQAKFKVMELSKVLIRSHRLKLPKLKVNVLYM